MVAGPRDLRLRRARPDVSRDLPIPARLICERRRDPLGGGNGIGHAAGCQRTASRRSTSGSEMGRRFIWATECLDRIPRRRPPADLYHARAIRFGGPSPIRPSFEDVRV